MKSNTMASTLKKQIGLQQIAPDTYTVGWHVDWTLGSSTSTICTHHAQFTYEA